jgi:hypothetical protein
MDAAGLILATGLMGLAGLPHCAAMCAAPCAAVTRGCGPGTSSTSAFQLGRVAGYALAGAIAASAIGTLQQALALAPALRPLWTLLHVGALALGLWMLVAGRLPAWRWAALPRPAAAVPVGWQRVQGPLRSGGFGLAWIAWPCALSQSALLVASLADRAWIGGAAMAAFAAASAPGLVAGPLLMRWAGARGGAWAAGAWPLRLAGLALVAGSGWALGHGLWAQVLAWCTT